jgi:hypothetical protein
MLFGRKVLSDAAPVVQAQRNFQSDFQAPHELDLHERSPYQGSRHVLYYFLLQSGNIVPLTAQDPTFSPHINQSAHEIFLTFDKNDYICIFADNFLHLC